VNDWEGIGKARMKLAKFNMGLGLRLTFAALLALILGGNALLIWQFSSARLQTERLTFCVSGRVCWYSINSWMNF
jgi:hypothetical protein